MQVEVVIAAAGSASRMGTQPKNKPYLELEEVPVLVHSLRFFEAEPCVKHVVIAASLSEVPYCREEIVKKYGFKKVAAVVEGGTTRQESVFKGLTALKNIGEITEDTLAAVHDAARPFPDSALFAELCAAALTDGGAVPGLKVKNTIKEITESGQVLRTPERENLRSIQTPQVFRFAPLYAANLKAREENFTGTDDAMLFEKYRGPVQVVTTAHDNLKITTPDDLLRLRNQHPKTNTKEGLSMRIGTGFDVHRLTENRRLIIGGVDIPFEKGLLGHSDADVLVHAICDALLGAAALGDIGQHFPDTDPRYAGADSLKLLTAVMLLLKDKGYAVVNVDATVMAERPKMKPHIPAMRENIAAAMGLDPDAVSVKATTTEKLGFTGREEGIAAEAVALISS